MCVDVRWLECRVWVGKGWGLGAEFQSSVLKLRLKRRLEMRFGTAKINRSQVACGHPEVLKVRSSDLGSACKLDFFVFNSHCAPCDSRGYAE